MTDMAEPHNSSLAALFPRTARAEFPLDDRGQRRTRLNQERELVDDHRPRRIPQRAEQQCDRVTPVLERSVDRHALADQCGAEGSQAHRLGFLQGRKVQSAGDGGESLEQEALSLPPSTADHSEQRATDRVRREGGQAVPLAVPVEHAIRLRSRGLRCTGQ